MLSSRQKNRGQGGAFWLGGTWIRRCCGVEGTGCYIPDPRLHGGFHE